MFDRDNGLRLVNAPKAHESGKRVIGFVINEDELECMGIFSPLLEQYCTLFLQNKGYKVEKGEKV